MMFPPLHEDRHGQTWTWLPPLTNYTLRCDCGRSYYHAIHSDELIHDCFTDNPQDHLVLMNFVQKNWKMLQKVPKWIPFSVFKIAIMNVTHKSAIQ